MISLCDKATEQARQRHSKRITAGHLKQAIIHEDQFDFLADIIEKVPDIPVPAEPGAVCNGDLTNAHAAGATAGAVGDDNGLPVKKARKPRQRKIKDEDAL